jgi:tetratricopeptide (TPR) repeat protein
MEYDYAVERNKKLYVIVCDEKFPFEPREQSEPQDKADLQAAHRKAVLAGEYLWLRVGTEEELRRAVERMKLPLDELRAELRRQQVRGRWFVGTIAAAIVLLLIGAIIGLSQLGRKVDDANQQVADVNEGVKDVKDTVGKLPEKIDESAQETVRQLTNPDALAASIRRQIEAAAKEKIDAVPKEESGRWEKIVEIERQRDVQLTQVDDLIQLIQDGLKEGATEVFLRAVEILNDSQQGGVDAAIAYLETRRPTTFEIARRHAQRAEREREQRNRALQALVLEAQLRENKLDWSAALKLREQVAELAPDWFEARNYLGTLLHQLARYPEAEPHKRAALALAATPKEKGSALNNLALSRVGHRRADRRTDFQSVSPGARPTPSRGVTPRHRPQQPR